MAGTFFSLEILGKVLHFNTISFCGPSIVGLSIALVTTAQIFPHWYGLRRGRGNRFTVVPGHPKGPFHEASIYLCLFICLHVYGGMVALSKAFYQDIPNFCMKGDLLTLL